MNRAEETLQLFKTLLKPTILILIWMSLLRALLVAGVFIPQIGLHPDLPAAFFGGMRFDILVLGFFWIPIVSLTWLAPIKLFGPWKVYLALIVILIGGFSAADLFWTATKNLRLNHEFFSSDFESFVGVGWAILGESRALIFLSAITMSGMGILLFLYQIKRSQVQRTISPGRIWFEIIASLFLVALAARGTWTPHHLNIEHAQVSQNKMINQIVLNPLWNMDK